MKIIWQTPDGKVYIGFVVCGYAIPQREFKTWAEFIAYVKVLREELIMCYDFAEYIYSGKSSKPVKDFIESIEAIDGL